MSIDSDVKNDTDDSTHIEVLPTDEQIIREEEWVDLLGSGAIMKKIIKEGKPNSKAQTQQLCVINYECSLEENNIIEKVENLEIDLGDFDVIQGLDLSVALMSVGEICLLKIEPRFAFGSKGLPPKVPGDSVLYYNVELISADFEDIESLTIQKRKVKGNKKRERGNWWYGRGENNIATQCYRRALDYLDEVEGGIKFPSSDDSITDAELQELLEDRISVYNNMAAAQIKLESYDAALTSLRTVLQCQPNNIKALFRQAKIYRAKNDVGLALKALQKANDLSPDDPDVQNELAKLKQILEKQRKSERDLAKRMFGGSTKEIKKSTAQNKVFLWATIAASVAVGLIGMATYRFKFP